jgi:putative AdoMet-dependent methyltransferase
VVFSFPAEEHASRFDSVVSGYTEPMRTNFVRHLAREYSTSDWIMEGLLTRAGFHIETRDYQGGVFARYLCRKQERPEREEA